MKKVFALATLAALMALSLSLFAQEPSVGVQSHQNGNSVSFTVYNDSSNTVCVFPRVSEATNMPITCIRAGRLCVYGSVVQMIQVEAGERSVNIIQTTPTPPPQAYVKGLAPGATVEQPNTSAVAGTVYAQLSDGHVASFPQSSMAAFQKAYPDAKALPAPQHGEALVQLSNGKAATLPLTSMDALQKADPGHKVIAIGSGDVNMQAGQGSTLGAAANYFTDSRYIYIYICIILLMLRQGNQLFIAHPKGANNLG